ncbi:MAG: glucosidase, partial [Acidobacteriaceae bacterium]|nr:glucosidase [Acidobacteriaceae bacterium]
MSVVDAPKSALDVSVNVRVKGEMTAEQARLDEPFEGYVQPWKKWGPYLSERSWGTVREDYSADGNAWDYFSHDMARSKAYRWGEDGIAGLCDRYQILAFALALWNGRDPILKERMFGLTCSEGNRGEDVKEYYFYLDSTPTHSYMRMLYKYPQKAYPYDWIVAENRKRCGRGREFELLDTGVFDDDRYFDVVIEYAKAGPEDICIRFEAFNRGPDDAELHLIPQLWFRNTWAWGENALPEPNIVAGPTGSGYVSLLADDSNATPPANLQFTYRLGSRYLYAPDNSQLLFTNNETNTQRLWGLDGRKKYSKDAFHRYFVDGEKTAVDPERHGTKACVHSLLKVPAGGSAVLRLRLTPDATPKPLAEVDKIVSLRHKEADEFYATIHPPKASAEERMIQRQALAGMFWSKQIYLFDVGTWLDGDKPSTPPPSSRNRMRNIHWRHLNSMRILSMPEKW